MKTTLTGSGVDGDGLLSRLLDKFDWLDVHKLSRVRLHRQDVRVCVGSCAPGSNKTLQSAGGQVHDLRAKQLQPGQVCSWSRQLHRGQAA